MEAAKTDVEIPDKFAINFLEMSDGVKLKHIRYDPPVSKGKLFLYPGINTLVLSWIHVLNGMSEAGFSIDYVESREKYTAKISNKDDFSKERMIKDCEESVALLGLAESDYIALGSSLGAVTLLHCAAAKTVNPKHLVLVGPLIKIKMPFAFKLLFPFTNDWTYRKIGKVIMQKIVLKKYTNEDADKEQKQKYMLALELARAVRLKKTLSSWNGSVVTDDLSKIDGSITKCYCIAASQDKLHGAETTKFIADKIENSEYVDLKTNTAAHRKPIIDLMVRINGR